jgi:hypothetical protein
MARSIQLEIDTELLSVSPYKNLVRLKEKARALVELLETGGAT